MEIFKSILITSAAGSALAAVITLLRPVTKKLFGYSWHYYIWLCVLFVMLVPVRFNIKPAQAPNLVPQTEQAQSEIVLRQSQVIDNIIEQESYQAPQPRQKVSVILNTIIYNRLNILACLWLIGAAALILLNIARYIRLNIKIKRNTEIISCPELRRYTDKKIIVRAWKNTASPFMTGIFRPMLILPDTELSAEQLHNILSHEIMHFKRHDILYKYFAEFVKCVHWFNPIAWYAAGQIAEECEISCDMAVTKSMSDSEKMSYVGTILSLLPTGKSKRIPLTTQMASSKKMLKRRFIMIKNTKITSKFTSLISAVIAIAALSITVFASGVLSDLAADDYTVETFNNGEKIELESKPFIENGEVYLPLREVFEKSVAQSSPKSYIEWNDGKIKVCLAYEENILHCYHLEIGNPEMYFEQGNYLTQSPVNFNAPILKNSLTYVSYSMLDHMLRRDWLIDFKVYDKSGALTDSTKNAISDEIADSDSNDDSAETKVKGDPETVISGFFKAFENDNFDLMKKYCTDSCIDTYFRDSRMFGMRKAALTEINIDPSEYLKSSNEIYAFVSVDMTPHSESIYAPDQKTASFGISLMRQADGGYLIDNFSVGIE